MKGQRHDPFAPDGWLSLMGTEPTAARCQPIHPVMITEGKVGLFCHGVMDRFIPGTRVALRADDQRVFLVEEGEGIEVHEPHYGDGRDPVLILGFPECVSSWMEGKLPVAGMLLDGNDGLEILPIRVVEHEADVFGPRIIDELLRPPNGSGPSEIVRHLVKGLSYDEWTAEAVLGLEDLLCDTPFRKDPLDPLAAGQDWVAWKTRKSILGHPGYEDALLHEGLVREVFRDQSDDGSWCSSPLKTAYGVLHALSMGVSPGDPRLLAATTWLLYWPEPSGRPGLWMLSEDHLCDWEDRRGRRAAGKPGFYPIGSPMEDAAYVRAEAQQRVMATCARHFSGLCDAMLHVSATAAYALCRCGYADHPRVERYANSMLQLAAMFGYFCACWGIHDYGREVESLESRVLDFDGRADQRAVALKSIPYGFGRDLDDLQFLARIPQLPGIHRPDLADTNGWWPYEWRDIGVPNHFALVGTYWQNADCWAKANRALSQLPGCHGSTTEFFALFQCQLYQTSLGEWNQGFPAGLLQWLADVTYPARQESAIDDNPLLRFAKLMVLKTVPWLREHQGDDGLWDHALLSRQYEGAAFSAPSARLTTYHIVRTLREFGLLDGLRPKG